MPRKARDEAPSPYCTSTWQKERGPRGQVCSVNHGEAKRAGAEGYAEWAKVASSLAARRCSRKSGSLTVRLRLWPLQFPPGH